MWTYYYAVDFLNGRVVTVERISDSLEFKAFVYESGGRVTEWSPETREYSHEVLQDAENYRRYYGVDWEWKSSPYPGGCEHARRDWTERRCMNCGHDGIPLPKYGARIGAQS